MRFRALLLPREIGIFGACCLSLLWRMCPHLCVVAVGEVQPKAKLFSCFTGSQIFTSVKHKALSGIHVGLHAEPQLL